MSRLHSFANDDIAFPWRLFVCNASFRIYITECLMLTASPNIIDICLNCVHLHRLLIYQFDTVSSTIRCIAISFICSMLAMYGLYSVLSLICCLPSIGSSERSIRWTEWESQAYMCNVLYALFYPMHNFSASIFAHNLNLRKRTILFSVVLKHSWNW